jgi:hypothetical protein
MVTAQNIHLYFSFTPVTTDALHREIWYADIIENKQHGYKFYMTCFFLRVNFTNMPTT